MKHCYFFYWVICFLLPGCTPHANHNTDIYTIDFVQCFDTERQMAISEIADRVEYIELKTPEDVIITKIWDVKQIDKFLIIRARLDVYLFHTNGQFIRQVGSRGQGPGEYLVPGEIEIDRKKKEIVISDTQKLLFFDLDGNFLRSKIIMDIEDFGIFDSILWTGEVIYSANRQKYKAVAVSLQDPEDTLACIPNALYGIIKSDKTGATNFPLTKLFYHKNDSLFFKGDESNDTIWRLSGAHAEPYVFIDMGKYKMPVEFERWVSDEAYRRNRDKYWCVPSAVEDGRYFFLLSQNRGSTKANTILNYIVYDKKQKKGFSVKDSKGIGLTDDILGGPPVWARWISDEYYINAITAEELLEKVKSGDFTPPPPLKEQLSRMNGESNDLIILCRRKK